MYTLTSAIRVTNDEKPSRAGGGGYTIRLRSLYVLYAGEQPQQRKASHTAMSADVSSYHAQDSGPLSRRHLSLADQRLTELPANLTTRLEEEDIAQLDLSNNRLSPLPADVGSFARLARLTRLDLSSNGLKEFPTEICRLRSLEVLVAKHNRMKSLPSDFGELKGLLELNLSGNGFEHFPPQLCELEGLRVLHLGANFIRKIPAEIKNLERYEQSRVL